MKVPNEKQVWEAYDVSLSRLQNEGSQPGAVVVHLSPKSIKATE